MRIDRSVRAEPFPPQPPRPREAKVVVCVDRWTQTEFCGVFYHIFLGDTVPSADQADLILKMDRLFDGLEHPQAAVRARDLPRRRRGEGAPDRTRILGERIYDHRRGKEVTFCIQILYRQNATWQGTLQNMGKKGAPPASAAPWSCCG